MSDKNSTFNVSKIAIWGPPASGKSYLTVELGQQYKISNIIQTDDYLSWNHLEKWVFMPKQAFLNHVVPKLSQSSWIIDGNLGEYISREQILREADIVFILNPNYLKLLFRVITRTLSRNSWMHLGTHTTDNANIASGYTIKDILTEILESIHIIKNFKRRYIHYLLRLANKLSVLSKIKICR